MWRGDKNKLPTKYLSIFRAQYSSRSNLCMHSKTIWEILCLIIISYLRRGGKDKLPARCLSIFKAVFLMCIMYVIVDVLKNTALAKTHDYVLKYNCGEGIKINGPPSTSRYTKWTHECYRYQPYAVADQMVSIYQHYLNMIINISTIYQYDYQYINNISI